MVNASTTTKVSSTGRPQQHRKVWYTHVGDTQDKDRRKATALAGFFWEKKDEGIDTGVKWEILKECPLYKPGSRSCDVCLQEKLTIMKDRDPRSLNVRSELMATCRHRFKFKLKKLKE